MREHEYTATNSEIEKAQDAVKKRFIKKKGSFVLNSLSDVLSNDSPTRRGCSPEAVGFVLDKMRFNKEINAKTYKDGNPDLGIAPGAARFWLTSKGRDKLRLRF